MFIERQDRLLRPLNYPEGTPGKGSGLFQARNGGRVLVLNAMGRLFMADLDDPFRALDAAVAACPLRQEADVIIVDFHAEATSEKQALAHFLDGQVSCVIGTHTHAPTADDTILPQGTAFMTDVGMSGDYDSVIGMNKDEPVQRFVQQIPTGRMTPAQGEATICGLAVETDDATGLARRIHPLRLGGRLRPALPDFWEKS